MGACGVRDVVGAFSVRFIATTGSARVGVGTGEASTGFERCQSGISYGENDCGGIRNRLTYGDSDAG